MNVIAAGFRTASGLPPLHVPRYHPRQEIRALSVKHALVYEKQGDVVTFDHLDHGVCALPGRDDHEDYDVLLAWCRAKGLEP